MEQLARELVKASWFILKAKEANQRCLVFSMDGDCRAVVVIVGFLVLREGWEVHRAEDYVLEQNPCILPLLGGYFNLIEEAKKFL